ncbi:hypothetical protein [Candidatus Uabimicrobium amorphum]|uniref:Uncharacterized protein n=1 Tax=Uabimicrobium amorphum TaxID=2596890 RepID=A0A5S9ISA9_UABAM|nr:hypothetical protein [Candidatus Uabimicrobium amorphum]BBM86817.1 hypothetical protein UABAM_05205 [Candidatus Uabimicrobium amorphum]
MIDKTDFAVFVYDIISNEIDSNCQMSDTSLQRSIDELYNNTPVSDSKYKSLLIATYKTMEEVAPLVSGMDMRSTMTAGEVKSIDSVWEKWLIENGVSTATTDTIVEKYSYDFIQVLQKEEEEED